ncbi:SAM-dependent methyltransferase [Ramlibacter humi]|uniref:site-specific DNA-methyltransferase (adenine-specific) n=2 Tax=Ramlibacter humi TaxID=2530451 RepID=A0A4Z0C1N1_9BURK|nr:SAM-dependent methyltransferase [Ramlibacter humi]
MFEEKIAKQAYEKIDKRRPRWTNEEEVRLTWITALETALDIEIDAERAKQDLSYNNVIIEFKARGLFKGSDKSAKFKEAMQNRLLPYIKTAAARTGIPEDEHIGIAIDGEHICFAQVDDGAITHGHLLPFSPESVGMVIEACRSNYRRAVIAENLLADFGHASAAASAVMQALADCLAGALASTKRTKIKMLFEEWRDLYGQVADLSSEQVQSIDQQLRFKWRGDRLHAMSGRLFVIHTYNSLVIKLLAAEIVSAHELTTTQSPAESFCAVLSPEDLIEQLESQIERGELFSGAGINGFVEEAIFSWHLDAARSKKGGEQLVPALKALIGKLALYRTDRLTRQRDALRDFYQGLVPETMRKSLGEFYTPDWLVELTVSKIKPADWLGPRFLDPTCGSGSFLVEVLRKKRAAAKKAGKTARQTLKLLCEEVWGFDLNPLAVQTARVNFLMEIADLIAEAPGKPIELPVLLADAIYSPAPNPDGADKVVEYKIGSQIAALTIKLPSTLAFDRARLDQVFALMGEHVESDHEYGRVAKALISQSVLSAKEAAEWGAPLKETYDQVLALHRRNWNGIWFRIVRNFFWSATAGTFDAIVGNPPWVRWSKLPEAYRERVKPTCEQYDIFSKTGYHGGNELDISAMITYTTGDKWLAQGGKLAFLVTQTLFQNPSSSGFRNFRVKPKVNLIPLEVEDLKGLKPFADAANKTALALFQKASSKPSYPVPYIVWSPADGEKRNIKPALTLSEVLTKVKRTPMEANPVGDDGSPWAVLPKGRFEEIRQLAVPSEWIEGRKGITVDLNGVYFVPVVDVNEDDRLIQIQTQPNSGKKDIGAARKFWIEPDQLFPLIKGASDFDACYFAPEGSLHTLVPNSGIRRAHFEAADSELAGLPKTKAYFKAYKPLLESRSTWKSRMAAQGAPYQSIYNVGEFTFKPWKVIWAEMSSTFRAAVAGSREVPLVGKRPCVPDHKIFFVAFDDESEAHFLCGLLNSTMVAQYVEAHNVSIQVGDIFKHMRLPKFDVKSAKHREVAELTKVAHRIANSAKREKAVAAVRTAADGLLHDWLATHKAV